MLVVFLLPAYALAQGHIIYASAEDSRGRDLIASSVDGTQKTRITAWTGRGHYPHFNAPAWSSVTQQLAYMVDVDGHDNYSIWISSSNGESAKRITPKSTEALYPSWSPDGRRLAFTARLSGVWEMFVIDVDGTNLTRLTQHTEQNIRSRWGGFSSWSPDGAMIYYHAQLAGTYGIYRIVLDSRAVERVTWLPEGARNPSWSPSGQWLAFLAPTDNMRGLYITRANGTDRRLVASGTFTGTPTWSPDETAIALTITEPSYNVGHVDLTSGAVRFVTNSRTFAGFPVWIDQ